MCRLKTWIMQLLIIIGIFMPLADVYNEARIMYVVFNLATSIIAFLFMHIYIISKFNKVILILWLLPAIALVLLSLYKVSYPEESFILYLASSVLYIFYSKKDLDKDCSVVK